MLTRLAPFGRLLRSDIPAVLLQAHTNRLLSEKGVVSTILLHRISLIILLYPPKSEMSTHLGKKLCTFVIPSYISLDKGKRYLLKFCCSFFRIIHSEKQEKPQSAMKVP